MRTSMRLNEEKLERLVQEELQRFLKEDVSSELRNILYFFVESVADMVRPLQDKGFMDYDVKTAKIRKEEEKLLRKTKRLIREGKKAQSELSNLLPTDNEKDKREIDDAIYQVQNLVKDLEDFRTELEGDEANDEHLEWTVSEIIEGTAELEAIVLPSEGF